MHHDGLPVHESRRSWTTCAMRNKQDSSQVFTHTVWNLEAAQHPRLIRSCCWIQSCDCCEWIIPTLTTWLDDKNLTRERPFTNASTLSTVRPQDTQRKNKMGQWNCCAWRLQLMVVEKKQHKKAEAQSTGVCTWACLGGSVSSCTPSLCFPCSTFLPKVSWEPRLKAYWCERSQQVLRNVLFQACFRTSGWAGDGCPVCVIIPIPAT